MNVPMSSTVSSRQHHYLLALLNCDFAHCLPKAREKGGH